MLQMGILWADTLLLGALASTTEAGVYAASTRFLIVGTFAGMAITTAFAPQISMLLGQSTAGAGADSLFKTATVWFILLAWPIYLTVAIFSPALVETFGVRVRRRARSSYRSSASRSCTPRPPARSTCSCSWAAAARLSLVNNIAALAVNIVLNLVLIPSMGLRGAALAWSASLVLTNLLPTLEVHHTMGHHPYGRTWLRAVLVAAGTVALPMLVVRAVLGPDQLGLAVGLVVAASPTGPRSSSSASTSTSTRSSRGCAAGPRRGAPQTGDPCGATFREHPPDERRSRTSLVGRHHRLRRRRPAALEAGRRLRGGPHGRWRWRTSFTRPTVYVSRAQIALPDSPSDNPADNVIDTATELEVLKSERRRHPRAKKLKTERSISNLRTHLGGRRTDRGPGPPVAFSDDTARDSPAGRAGVHATPTSRTGPRKAVAGIQKRADAVQAQIDAVDETIEGLEEELDEPRPRQRPGPAAGRIRSSARPASATPTVQSLATIDAEASPTAQVITPAILPSGPQRSGIVKNGILGLMAGLVIGVGLAFVRDRFDEQVRESADVRGFTGVPSLGAIPVLPESMRYAPFSLVAVHAPETTQADAFRRLRTSVTIAADEARREGHRGHQLGRRRGQVDDGRQPGRHPRAERAAGPADLGRPPPPDGREHARGADQARAGRGAVPRGRARGHAARRRPAHGAPGRAGTTAAPPTCSRRRRCARSSNRPAPATTSRVIDTPPVLAVADVLGLASMVEGMIIVVAVAETSEAQVADAADQIRASGASEPTAEPLGLPEPLADEDAAGQGGVEGEEAVQHRQAHASKALTCGPAPGPAAVRMSARPSPLASTRPDRARRPGTPGRRRRSCQQRGWSAPLKTLTCGRRRPADPGDDVGPAVAVDVAAADVDAAGEARRRPGSCGSSAPVTPSKTLTWPLAGRRR